MMLLNEKELVGCSPCVPAGTVNATSVRVTSRHGTITPPSRFFGWSESFRTIVILVLVASLRFAQKWIKGRVFSVFCRIAHMTGRLLVNPRRIYGCRYSPRFPVFIAPGSMIQASEAVSFKIPAPGMKMSCKTGVGQ